MKFNLVMLFKLMSWKKCYLVPFRQAFTSKKLLRNCSSSSTKMRNDWAQRLKGLMKSWILKGK